VVGYAGTGYEFPYGVGRGVGYGVAYGDGIGVGERPVGYGVGGL
jgi:hypothetical protein